MRHHRLTRSATLGLALVALVAPTAAAQAQDLRTPDTRDASNNAGTVSPALPADLRSPDARETVGNTVTGGPTDLRTPDTRDASNNAGTVSPALPADLRSPDARETVGNTVTGGPTDLRTADARDAADGRGTFNAPEVALDQGAAALASGGRRHATGVTRASEPGPSWWSSCSDLGVCSRSCIVGTAHRLTAGPRSADIRSRIHARSAQWTAAPHGEAVLRVFA